MAFLIVTVVGCVLMLLVDTTPGLFQSSLFYPCISCSFLSVAAGSWGLGWRRAVSRCAPRERRRSAVIASAVVVVTFILCAASLPSRVALWAVRHKFEALLADAPVEHTFDAPGRWVGCFYIDAYVADGKGGVYFRTATRPDQIFDTWSHGFAYRPHPPSWPYGHPFGNSKYRATWLFGEWYSFSVSDD